MKKQIKITLELILSIIITLLLFYLLSWYSFNTLPTKTVLLRMIIVTLIIFDLFELITYGKTKKMFRK